MCRSSRTRPEVAGPADDRRAAGAAALRRLRQDRRTGGSMNRLPDAVGAFIDWLVNESGWTVEEDGEAPCRSGHAHICHPLPPLPQFRAPTSPGPTSARSRRGAFRTCWSAAAPSTIARRSSPCATRSPRSSGPTTSSGSSRRCAGRSSRSATMRSSPSGNMSMATARSHSAPASDAMPSTGQLSMPRAPGRRRARRCCAQLHVGRNHRPVAETITMLLEARARPRRHRALADRRAGARQLSAADRPRAALRARRNLVPRLRRDASRRMPSAARRARRRSSRRAPKACG